MSIWMPWIEPENVSPAIPWIPVTLADSVSRKLVGSVLMSGHWIPIASMWIGSQLGHWKLLPSAAPTDSAMPKPGPARNEPSPRNAKLVACPESIVRRQSREAVER